jgi:response regulator RpfG family c-di-GMP phosphodiesterase
MNDRRYLAIPPGAIIPGSLPKFRIYVLSPQEQYILWALEGNEVRPEQLDRLSEGGLKEVYVDIEEQFKYEQYLEDNLGDILESQWSSDDQKATIFSKVSTNVVRNAFETCFRLGAMSAEALRQTQRLIENALLFIMQSKSIQALAKMIGHNYQTYEHATKVLWFTAAFLRDNPDILEEIQPGYQALNERHKLEMLKQCGVGALLHDIGKALVSKEILNKKGPLNEVEWEIMKRHPLNGLAMLVDTDLPPFVKKAVLHHHEDYDGGGYPLSLEGTSIHTLARVLRIIDTFDAMTSRRPYKGPITAKKTAQIMIGMQADQQQNDESTPDDRDQGMRRCFDDKLLQRFIQFLGNVKLEG